jgi:hypothetical protein
MPRFHTLPELIARFKRGMPGRSIDAFVPVALWREVRMPGKSERGSRRIAQEVENMRRGGKPIGSGGKIL